MRWNFTLGSINVFVTRTVGSHRFFIEHDEIVAYYFRNKFLIAFLVFPAAGFEAAFNINQASLVQVFLRQLSRGPARERPYAILFGKSVYRFAIFIGFGGGQREFCHGYVSLPGTAYPVFAKIAYQHDPVNSSHST